MAKARIIIWEFWRNSWVWFRCYTTSVSIWLRDPRGSFKRITYLSEAVYVVHRLSRKTKTNQKQNKTERACNRTIKVTNPLKPFKIEHILNALEKRFDGISSDAHFAIQRTPLSRLAKHNKIKNINRRIKEERNQITSRILSKAGSPPSRNDSCDAWSWQ
jgi:hypothetical protein